MMAIRSLGELLRFITWYFLVLGTLFLVLPAFGIMIESGWDRLALGVRMGLIALPLGVVVAGRYIVQQRNRRKAIHRYFSASQ